MLGGSLRETAPSIHEEVESLATRHPVVHRDRSLLSTILQLFHTIVDWLPAEIVTYLAPVPEDKLDPVSERGAVQLLTRSRRWQPRVRARTSFAWPHEEVYEFSDSLLPRSRPGAPEEFRRAAEAAYKLFVRVAVALFQIFEKSVVDPATVRRLQRQFAK